MGMWKTKTQLTGMLNVFAKSSPIKRRADWCKKLRQVIIITDLMVHLKMLRSIMATHSKRDDANKERNKQLWWNPHVFLGLKNGAIKLQVSVKHWNVLLTFKCNIVTVLADKQEKSCSTLGVVLFFLKRQA